MSTLGVVAFTVMPVAPTVFSVPLLGGFWVVRMFRLRS